MCRRTTSGDSLTQTDVLAENWVVSEAGWRDAIALSVGDDGRRLVPKPGRNRPMHFWRRLLQCLPRTIVGCREQPAGPEGSAQVILADVYWAFRGDAYESLDEFANAVAAYHDELNLQVEWPPAGTVVEAPGIRVSYMHWQGDDQVDAVVELAADNGESFGASELLFKLHNAVVNDLRDDDHQFFEGLHLVPAEEGVLPTYALQLGS